MVEPPAHNRSVLGSSPSGSTIKIKLLQIFTVRAFLWSGVLSRFFLYEGEGRRRLTRRAIWHSLARDLTNAARDLAQFSARFGTPLTYKLSKLAHCMQRPGECLPAFAFTLRVWGMAVFSASDACAMTASKRGRTGTDGMRAGSPGLYFHAVCAHVLMKGGVPS